MKGWAFGFAVIAIIAASEGQDENFMLFAILSNVWLVGALVRDAIRKDVG